MARILYFGKLSSIFGKVSEQTPLPDEVSDTKALREWLDETRNFNGALMHSSVRMAVNSEIIADPFPVSDSDEIAFLPPVGGG
ncbi:MULTISPECIES: MoaD/ThiS family protein [Hyphomonas]|uniref:Molybdopterin synthase sulfur carrier subunit n=1 Tax=Hyphomonas adhaerens TaxID=81029 RepID=A0A3B9GXP6_9PROT|nr:MULTISPECIES: MoaD/ThiS family protein [Hyphomonas]MBB40381.1 molybdopterin synthase sulfur carrier subunit [Hyphomonas sp.]HAE27212.1 molybdopterin synthase sulfur carrier subunit [Hyphomonas adhaerens]|tara:strand:+ start:12217 stop:12465 length:249 start_codon:yes stop_codon:yes gene_type:complete